MTSALEPQIDVLYQLPLDRFTKARNALAKTLSGAERKLVSALPKPSLPAWAVNQLYWNNRPTYAALIDAAERLRAAHRAVVSGQKADVRKSEALHQAALARAVSSTGQTLASHGHTSAATGEAVRGILVALPTDVQAGRLTREPEPAGFGLLVGVTPRAMKAVHPRPSPSPHPKITSQPSIDRQLAQAESALKKARVAMVAETAKAKRITTALQRLERTEALHQAALDKLVKSREGLEAQRVQQERDARRLAGLAKTAEQTLMALRETRSG